MTGQVTTAPATDPEWQREQPSRRGLLIDALAGVLLAVATATSAYLSRNMGWEFGDVRPSVAEETAWAAVVALPLCVRRQAPLTVLLVCSVAFIGLQSRYVAESTLSSICLFLALYTAGAWGAQRRVTAAVRALVVIAMFAWLSYAISATAYADLGGQKDAATSAAIYNVLINVLFFAGAWYFGDRSWAQARQSAELADSNRQLALERDENARRAVVAERIRIARELHDVVAHHVSLMGVQAGAARSVLDRDPDLARRTLTSIEATGRSAVGEMHRLLGVLRESPDGDSDGDADAPRAPAPGLADLPDLVAATAGTGLQADFTVVGDVVEVPPSIAVSAYRVVQEALTNTLRHAGARRVDVRLRYLPGALETEIVDDGRGAGTAGTRGSGLGHVGMRERVALHAGDLEIGPRPDGGFRVRARFPLAPQLIADGNGAAREEVHDHG